MAGRGWTAVLLLFAVLSVHGLQCGSAADGATHPGGACMVSVAVTAPAAGGAHPVDVEATHAGPPAAVAEMAEEEVADRPNADAIALAEAIRNSQNAEIAEMQQLLTQLGG